MHRKVHLGINVATILNFKCPFINSAPFSRLWRPYWFSLGASTPLSITPCHSIVGAMAKFISSLSDYLWRPWPCRIYLICLIKPSSKLFNCFAIKFISSYIKTWEACVTRMSTLSSYVHYSSFFPSLCVVAFSGSFELFLASSHPISRKPNRICEVFSGNSLKSMRIRMPEKDQ